MAEKLDQTVKALVSSIEEHISTKTVIGEPVVCGDTVIFPMADVSFGVAAGSFNQDKKNNGTGGAGVKMSPTAVLIISGGTSRVVNIKDNDSMNKIINMVPDVLNMITGLVKDKKSADAPAEGEAGEADIS